MSKVKLPANAAELIDELGQIDAAIAPLEKLNQRKTMLRKEIAGWFESCDAEQDFAVDGRRYAVHVSARRSERRIVSMAKVMAELGQKNFLQVCSVALKDLPSNVTEDPRCVAEERVGPRTVRTVERLVAPASAMRKKAA